jgi:hypothetical protein
MFWPSASLRVGAGPFQRLPFSGRMQFPGGPATTTERGSEAAADFCI